MADLAALKKQRGHIKTKLTNFENFLRAFKPDTDDISVLKSRLKHFEPQLAAFDDLQVQIVDVDRSDEQVQEALKFEERFHTAVGTAVTYIERKNGTSSSTATSNDNSVMKLPKMNLPTFNGNYDQWLNFHDAFKTMIHENESLSGIQKFYYLRSSLEDSAAEVTQSLVSSEENYKVAWELLTKRSDNKKIMIENHLQALFDIPTMQKDSGSALRQMLDSLQKHIRSLKVLGADTRDAMLTHMIAKRMDVWTKREWNTVTKDTKKPTVAEMLSFLEDRCIIVGANTAANPSSKPNVPTTSRQSKGGVQSLTCVTTDSIPCPVCKDSHQVYKCPVFRNLSVHSRVNEVEKHKLCKNCLRIHSDKCTLGRCRKCNQFHNSLLHEEKGHNATNNNIPTSDTSDAGQVNYAAASDGDNTTYGTSYPSNSTVTLTQCEGTRESQVLLSTALILVHDKDGNVHECRALLDSGSQSNLVTRELSNRLSLPRERIIMPINGVNNTLTNVRQRINVKIKSRFNDYESQLPFLVIDFIVGSYPAKRLNTSGIRIPENLTLTDPTFNHPGRIDLLIGAGSFWDLLCVGKIKLANGQPTLQMTQLGWVIADELTAPIPSKKHSQQVCGLAVHQQTHDKMEQFWKLEECAEKPRFTHAKQACEEQYKRTNGRVTDGRFLLQLPLRGDPTLLGNSKQIALKRFYAMEHELLRQPELKMQDTKFMSEYEELKHMTQVNETQPEPQATCYTAANGKPLSLIATPKCKKTQPRHVKARTLRGQSCGYNFPGYRPSTSRSSEPHLERAYLAVPRIRSRAAQGASRTHGRSRNQDAEGGIAYW